VNEMVPTSSPKLEILSCNKNKSDVFVEGSELKPCTSHDKEDISCSNRDDGKEQIVTTPNVIGRQVLRSDGVYIEGQVEGFDVNFTVDTGATRTVLSVGAFNKLPKSCQPNLEKSSTLASADGKPLQELGKAIFRINLGELSFEMELIVAHIEDEALLGLDILMKAEWGPADLRLSEGIMLLGGTIIHCVQIGQTGKVRKIRVAEDLNIPPRCEIIVDVFVDRYDQDSPEQPQDFILEPADDFMQHFPVIMAPTLVDISQDVTSKVRIMNPFDTEFLLKQDTVLGKAEKLANEPVLLVESENSTENSNFDPIRCIQLLGTSKPIDWETNVGVIRNIAKKGTSDGGKSGQVPSHLQSMFEEAAEGRPPEERALLAQFLQKFSKTFSQNDTDLGRTNLIEHSIETGDSRPIKQPPRRVPMAFAGEEKKLIDQMLSQEVIRKSSSPWSSPLVLVMKKNGKVRPCVDYRRLNSVTKKDAFPLPRIQDCLDTVAGATLFSTFDLTSGFHQIPVKVEDIPKTAFVSKYGLFEYVTVPFGVCNGPPTCQRLMELILSGLQWQICLIYLDDVIVFGSTFNEHIERLELVLQRISDAGLKLKPEKCKIFKPEVTFLGHVVSANGIQPNPDNISKILSWPVPKTVSEVRQILGMGSYYRRFIKDFSLMVKPLTELTKKANAFIWSKYCQEAFENLKQAFISPEIMGYPTDQGDFILDTDACDSAIGAVLSQIQDGRPRVIAYGSRTLNKAERNYCTTDKELLAVRYFIEYYRQYLLGRPFTVRTDHQALIWLFSLKEPKGRIARWIEILSAFEFMVEYRPGPKHCNADVMSRCKNPHQCDCPQTDNLEYLKCGPCTKCLNRAQNMMSSMKSWNMEVTEEVTPAPEPPDFNKELETVNAVKTRKQTENDKNLSMWKTEYSLTELQTLQANDEDIGPVLQWKIDNNRPCKQDIEVNSPATRHYWFLWDSLKLINGLLYKECIKKDGTGQYNQFLTPLILKDEVLNEMHNSILSGHLGRKKTKEKLAQRFYWYEMREDISIWISKCEICASIKPPQKNFKAPLGSMPTGAPWDRLATDILGPLPLTPRGNRYVLTVTDYFTK